MSETIPAGPVPAWRRSPACPRRPDPRDQRPALQPRQGLGRRLLEPLERLGRPLFEPRERLGRHLFEPREHLGRQAPALRQRLPAAPTTASFWGLPGFLLGGGGLVSGGLLVVGWSSRRLYSHGLFLEGLNLGRLGLDGLDTESSVITVHSAQCTVHRLQFTAYSVQSLQFTVYI